MRSLGAVWHFLCSLRLLILFSACALGQDVASSSNRDQPTIRIMPDIVSIPPPITYFDKSRPDTPLTCEVWPPNANVSILSVRRMRQGAASSSHDVAAASGGLPLHPLKLDSFHQQLLLPMPNSTSVRAGDELLSPAESGRRRPLPSPFSNVALRIQPTESFDVSRVDSIDFVCKATTKFGTIISSPFALVRTRLHEFKRTSLPSRETQMTFIQGNVAYVSCNLPPDSQPPPTVHFFHNGTLVENSDKYKQIHRPGENRVMLLIYPFKEGDEGVYTCRFRNPVTGEEMRSPETVRLGRSVSTRPVSETILLPLAPEDNATHLASNRQIHVREGDNVTLFCVMQASPPPQTRTYCHATEDNNFLLDDKFGLLHITNVRPKDAATYICSGTRRTVTAQLVVKPRLRLTQSPVDVRVSRFGERAEFRCASSDPQVLPTWLFNGDPVSTFDPTVLVIESVKESDLGVYQCIARSLTRDGKTDEWVSAYATLALHPDEIVSKAADLSRFVPLHPPQSVQPAATTSEMTPRVEILFDNLAVYMAWKVSEETLLRGAASQQQHQQRQFTNAYDQRTLHQPLNALFRIEYAIQTSQPTVNPALVGLVEPDPPTWTDPQLVDDAWKGQYAFLTSPPLQPGRKFRFRLRALDTDSGLDLVPPSDWSETVSTEHISTAAPPKILSVQPYMDDRLNVTWYYSGNSNENGGESLPGDPIEAAVFKPDFFLILARPVQRVSAETAAVGPKIPSAVDNAAAATGSSSSSGGDAGHSASNADYGVYQATQVNGSDAREGFIYNLNASFNYQVVVYGVKFDNGVRRITRFSEPFDVILPPPPRSRFSLMSAFMNNKVIFIALGSLALLMLLIILILIVMCIWRQQKDRRRQRVKQNGFVCGFKESDKYANQQQQQQQQQQQHQHDGSTSEGGHLLHRPPSPNSKVSSGGGNAMAMDTLMRSNFSEPDAQQKLLQQQQHQQQQQFAMNTLPHMLPAGSAMHLSGAGGGGGFYSPYYPTSQQQQQQQQHHQSHHSLLMSPPPAGTPVFQSGTLPGGPAGRYMRQQQPLPPPVAFVMGGGQQYGSQQVLSQEFASPDQQQQASLLRDYYQQQQQQQQQQLYQQALQQQQQQQACMYPGGNPAAFLPPQHPGDTMTRRQSHQSAYYGGGPPGSGNSVASLKRDAPSGGSMHDACSLDPTLLVRGGVPMSPQAMDNSPTGPIPQPPAYFHGSQQALHMASPSMQYMASGGPPGYAMSPGSQVPIYQQQQQQQAAFMMQQQQQPMSPFYGGPPQACGIPPDSGLIRHHSMGHHTDGESIYSYFSQQDVCHPQAHGMLNTLPEENHMNLGFAESGSQTAGLNGTLTGNSVTGSPALPGGHRHHRRRRRKQQQQQLTGEAPVESPAPESNGFQQSEAQMLQQQQQQQQQYSGYSDQAVGGQFANVGPPGYSENTDGGGGNGGFQMMNDQGGVGDGSPIAAAAGLDQACGGDGDGGSPMGHEMHHLHHQNQSLDRGISYSTGPRGGIQNSTGPLPPPSQPPPPPPAPPMGLPPPGYYVRQDSGSLMMDSLNRRPPGGALGGSGLLVGPPPRIRDYSEYGIPAGIHHHTAPGAASSVAQGPPNVATGSTKPVQTAGGKPPAYNGGGGTPMSPGGLQNPPFNGRYREGQA